jgi:hypothetical protein
MWRLYTLHNVRRTLSYITLSKCVHYLICRLLMYKKIYRRGEAKVGEVGLEKTVGDNFSDKKDLDNGKPLFNELAQKKIAGVLDQFEEGYFSDLPGYSFYARKLNDDGTEDS